MSVCAARLRWDEVRTHKMAEEMVAGLSSLGQLTSAAALAIQHLNDVDGAVSLLAQACHWRSALHQAYRWDWIFAQPGYDPPSLPA